MADNPELRRGSEGEWVTYLQQLLEAAGNPPGAIDGDFGPITEAAVRAYQEAHGCVVDGWVGPETWGAPTGSAEAAEGGGIADWGADPEQWTADQQNQYFAYNDVVVDYAEGLDAELDVPEIQEAEA
ncbi:MAG: peptidoglycan-binding domain-containing protein [Ilumatobacteraceae bacterium]